jgi:hypothetical protein
VDTSQLIRGLPKAELHIHIEGTLEVAEILRLVRRGGGGVPEPFARLLNLSGATGSSTRPVVAEVGSFHCGLPVPHYDPTRSRPLPVRTTKELWRSSSG